MKNEDLQRECLAYKMCFSLMSIVIGLIFIFNVLLYFNLSFIMFYTSLVYSIGLICYTVLGIDLLISEVSTRYDNHLFNIRKGLSKKYLRHVHYGLLILFIYGLIGMLF